MGRALPYDPMLVQPQADGGRIHCRRDAGTRPCNAFPVYASPWTFRHCVWPTGLPGRRCSPLWPPPRGRSAVSAGLQLLSRLPTALTTEAIGVVQRRYAEAARRARQVGFDMVEIHGANGYLPVQFLSPRTNRRRDRYGGSLENRMRFFLELFDAVQDAVGRGAVSLRQCFAKGGAERPRVRGLGGGLTPDPHRTKAFGGSAEGFRWPAFPARPRRCT
jgi:hypothetical protein